MDNGFDWNQDVNPRKSIYTKYIKRLLDIVLCSFALIVLSPVFLVVIILELKYHGRPIFYKTERPGLNGEPFEMIKFRSMTNLKDEQGNLLPDAERLTPFGLSIRKWSIDELPELINIIRGDMSIIGPRPLLCKYMDYYTPRHKMRHCVRPGLCCVKVNQCNNDKIGMRTWRDQFEDDIYYVENVSFLIDVKMVIAVLKKALRHEEYRSEALRVEFNGTNLDETRSVNEIKENE